MGDFGFIEIRKISWQSKTAFIEFLLILCSIIPVISNESFNKDIEFCKSSKCFNSDAMLRWRVEKGELLFILS